MKNDQRKPDTRTLWDLKRTPLTDKPKEERILDTVNRVISRIQNDEGNAYDQTPLPDLLEMSDVNVYGRD